MYQHHLSVGLLLGLSQVSLLSVLAHCADVTALHSAGVINTIVFILVEKPYVAGVLVSQSLPGVRACLCGREPQ